MADNWKNRNIRVSEPLWRAAQAKAHAEGENLSEMIRHMLRTYVGDDAAVSSDAGKAEVG